jgi:hypothetical protein
MLSQIRTFSHSANGAVAVVDAFRAKSPMIEVRFTPMRTGDFYGRPLSAGHPISLPGKLVLIVG